MDMAFIWLIIIIVLIIIEVLTSYLTTIWFVLSGIIALILSYFIDSIFIQFGVFTILGIVFLLITRPIVKKYMVKEKIPTNADRVIGKKGIVTEDIEEDEYGEVKVDGKRWTAYSSKEIKEGSKVEILSIDGVKLKVKEWEEK